MRLRQRGDDRVTMDPRGRSELGDGGAQARLVEIVWRSNGKRRAAARAAYTEESDGDARRSALAADGQPCAALLARRLDPVGPHVEIIVSAFLRHENGA